LREGVGRLEREGKNPAVTAKHDNTDDQANQQATGSRKKAENPKAPAKGGHGIKIASVNNDDSDDNKIASAGATRSAVLQALAAAAVRGKVVVKHGDGGAGMCSDKDAAAAA
jgi:hypothetical protein